MDADEKHKDITIGIYLFCMSLDSEGWNMKIWESAEALIPYTPVLEA